MAQLDKTNAYYARSMGYFADTATGNLTMGDWADRAISHTGRVGWPVGDHNAPGFVRHLLRLSKTACWCVKRVMFLGRLRLRRRAAADILGLHVSTDGLGGESPKDSLCCFRSYGIDIRDISSVSPGAALFPSIRISALQTAPLADVVASWVRQMSWVAGWLLPPLW